MKRLKFLKTFEAFTPPPTVDLPPTDRIEYVMPTKSDTLKTDTIKLSDAVNYIKGATEKTLDTLKSLNLEEAKLYKCLFGQFDDTLTGQLIIKKDKYYLDFRDLQDQISKYHQVNNLENKFDLRIFSSEIIKDRFPDIKEGSIFIGFRPEEEGSYIIYVDKNGKSHFTNIPDRLEFDGR